MSSAVLVQVKGLGCGVVGSQVEADGVLQLARAFVAPSASSILAAGRAPPGRGDAIRVARLASRPGHNFECVALEQRSVGRTTDKRPMAVEKALDLTRELHLALGKDDQVIARALQVGNDV